MRGPLVFVLSLVAAAALGVLLVLPEWRERTSLADKIRDMRPASEEPGTTERAGVDAARRLSRALGLPRRGDPTDVRIKAVAAEFAPGQDVSEGQRTLELSLPWDRVLELCEWLVVSPGPAPAEVSVTATEDPELCQVKLRFAPGVTPR
ncbi:MAG: hypothetical protein ACYS99_18860 [Planctomycetota bacterium]|jgi:hypothetical protein